VPRRNATNAPTDKSSPPRNDRDVTLAAVKPVAKPPIELSSEPIPASNSVSEETLTITNEIELKPSQEPGNVYKNRDLDLNNVRELLNALTLKMERHKKNREVWESQLERYEYAKSAAPRRVSVYFENLLEFDLETELEDDDEWQNSKENTFRIVVETGPTEETHHDRVASSGKTESLTDGDSVFSVEPSICDASRKSSADHSHGKRAPRFSLPTVQIQDKDLRAARQRDRRTDLDTSDPSEILEIITSEEFQSTYGIQLFNEDGVEVSSVDIFE